MKKLIGYSIVAVVSFGVGTVAGWFARKKTSEVQFEVVDIQESSEEGESDKKDPPKDPIEQVNEQIDKLFNGPREHIIQEVDTQKEQYFKKWKAEEAVQKYDTRTKEEPEDPVVSEDSDEPYNPEEGIDPELLAEMVDGEDVNKGRIHPEIEQATMEDWEHWLGINDGEYDCEEIYWFAGDGVIADEDGDAINNPGKKLGFDVRKQFDIPDSEELTGDPDTRVVYNHTKNMIYQIHRRGGSYARKKGMEEFGSDYDDEDDG